MDDDFVGRLGGEVRGVNNVCPKCQRFPPIMELRQLDADWVQCTGAFADLVLTQTPTGELVRVAIPETQTLFAVGEPPMLRGTRAVHMSVRKLVFQTDHETWTHVIDVQLGPPMA